MTNKSENTKRLAKNTIMLYGRMLFSLVVSLYTSRAVLAALGETDYGVYNVVGGVVAMFSMLTGSLSAAISRFQSFELGKGNKERLFNAYSASVVIQSSMALVIFILVEILGVWFLNNHLTIPDGRMEAATVVLHCSLVTFLSSMLIVPFSASVVSHEDMGVFAIISVAEVLLKFLVAVFLSLGICHADNLKVYAILLMVCTLLIQVSYTIYCRTHYEECHLTRITDKGIFKEILSFAGWNFFGSMAGLLNGQGINIVMNMIFGPAVNAARGLATTVNSIVSNFVNSFTVALNPQIVKSYAANETEYLIFIIKRGVKFCFFIMFIISFPAILEADFLMNLWLVDVPAHTVSFVRLVLIYSTVEVMSIVPAMGQTATGDIKYFQIATSAVLLMNFVLSAIFLKLGSEPEIVYVISILVSVCILVVRLLFVRHSLKISIRDFFRTVYVRLLFVVVSSVVIPVTLYYVMDGGWLGFLVVSTACVICTAISVLFIGCDQEERRYILSFAPKTLSKIRGK